MAKKRNSTSRGLSSLSRGGYRFARTTNDLSALASGSPTRIAKRVANKAIGRGLGRFFLR